ncbi:tRNA pseudouridine(13) synthase TruD [Candidatus Halobonum tyrrellensis]|uniref:Probable tRNA pseudouridine synthase D n=1 Tax=Candidatus Halobonum tyrrellensis G22 TaxID=1324957 RepID=V4J2Q6_9EURY|nr:tRNA pseudouridine(13) synthase TruD [Candidatus Halobonum tyrrellensis]ESP89682.1 tRNA pseudouridine synthase D [Candidatus Halobonum tyrrellensis G22]
MREAHPRERTVGTDFYVSDADGIGGRLRATPEDFRVRERERMDPEPVDADPGSYPFLLLRATLRGWDTNDFAGRLSDAVGISRERVSWAGTKDKHAVTTQLFTVRGVDPADLPDVRDAEVDVLGRVGRALSFGDLAGNEFEIRVRDATGDPDPITAALRAFGRGEGAGAVEDAAEAGESDAAAADAPAAVPNYFGHQRFGSRRPVTHEVGLAVVRGDWRGAVLAYCGAPHEAEPDESQAARRVVEREAESDAPDWNAALDAMPGRLRYERSMLHRLVEGADWREALEAVPDNLQRLFVNAAQSYAFNRVVSERLRRNLPFDRPVAGDVCCFAERGVEFPKPDTDRVQRATDDRVDVLARHCQRGRAFVTAPLVGTETELADGEPGEIERAVLADLGVEPGDFALPGSFESTGTRRAIRLAVDLDVDSREGDPVFSFALPSGSYATTLLREYLKCDPERL